MSTTFARPLLIILALFVWTHVWAGQPFVPSWITNDPVNKTVALEIVADWNQVARYAKGNVRTDIIDFNGYWGGNLTITVPKDWQVRIMFINRSGTFRHSLMVTRPYAQSEMPMKLRPEDAIWGAYTDPPEGIYPQESARLDFVAQQAGSYYLACARQTHLMDGHWVNFEVRDGIEGATALVHGDRFPPEDPPGRT